MKAGGEGVGWGEGGRVGSGRAIVLGKFQCRGVLLIWIIVGQGPTLLAVGAGGGCFDFFNLAYYNIISSFFLPLSGRRLYIA